MAPRSLCPRNRFEGFSKESSLSHLLLKSWILLHKKLKDRGLDKQSAGAFQYLILAIFKKRGGDKQSAGDALK